MLSYKNIVSTLLVLLSTQCLGRNLYNHPMVKVCENAEIKEIIEQSETIDLEDTTLTRRHSNREEGCIKCCLNDKKEKIYFTLEGDGKQTIVLLHDLTLNSNIWACQVKAFRKHYKVLTIDLLGHGRSTKPKCDYSFDLFADSLKCVFSKLCIKKPIIVGMGLGGAIAQYYAAKYPKEVCKLVLVSSTPQFQADECFPYGMSSKMIKTLVRLLNECPEEFAKTVSKIFISEEQCKNDEFKKLRRTIAEIIAQNDPQAIQAIIEFIISTSLVSTVGDVKTKTLTIAGGLDIGVPVGASYFLNCSLCKSQQAIFAGNGHSPNLTNVCKFNELVLNFIKGCPIETCIQECSCDICPCISSKVCEPCCVKKEKHHRHSADKKHHSPDESSDKSNDESSDKSDDKSSDEDNEDNTSNKDDSADSDDSDKESSNDQSK